MKFQFNDGGRKAAGYEGTAGDCVCRAIAIATQLPYQQVYDALNEAGLEERVTRKRKKRGRSSARTGIYKSTIKRFLTKLGWTYTACMGIGTGCKVHLADGELPMGRLIVQVSRHMCAVIDGVLNDNHDCTRGGKRCVYGYWRKT